MKVLIEKLKSRIYKLTNFKYDKQELLDFYEANLTKNNIEIIGDSEGAAIGDLLMLCYFTYNNDDINKIKSEVYNLQVELEYFYDNIMRYLIDNNNDIYEFDLSYFNGTILSEERYFNALQQCFSMMLYIYSEEILEKVMLDDKSKGKIQSYNYLQKKCDIQNISNLIRNKYFMLKKERSKRIKKSNTELNLLYNLLTELRVQARKKDCALTLSTNLINSLEDDELKYHLYRILASYNNDYFVDLLNENKKLKLNNVGYLRYFFSEVKQDISLLTDEDLKIISNYGDLEKIVNILNILNSTDFKIINFNDEKGIKALVNTNADILNHIIFLLKQGIINSDFVIRNQGILYNIDITDNNLNTGLNNIITNNFNLLQTNNFNMNNSNLNEGLFTSSSKVMEITNLFQGYELNKNTSIPKSMLTNINFFSYIDKFIELGLYDFIRNNFNIINDNCENILKRIYIAKMMKFNIFDYNGKILPEILTGNGFYIPNNSLDNYIISESENMMDPQVYGILSTQEKNCIDLPKELSEFDKHFSINRNTYNFDNILISRNKVLRNYNTLVAFYPQYDKTYLLENAIIFNSILDIDLIYKIKNCIDEFYISKQKRI